MSNIVHGLSRGRTGTKKRRNSATFITRGDGFLLLFSVFSLRVLGCRL